MNNIEVNSSGSIPESTRLTIDKFTFNIYKYKIGINFDVTKDEVHPRVLEENIGKDIINFYIEVKAHKKSWNKCLPPISVKIRHESFRYFMSTEEAFKYLNDRFGVPIVEDIYMPLEDLSNNRLVTHKLFNPEFNINERNIYSKDNPVSSEIEYMKSISNNTEKTFQRPY
jgi:hypothetical protein